MTVDPVSRGGGLGRRLFRSGLARMRQDFPVLDHAVLIVNEHWAGARAIYAAEGFIVTGRLEGFFKPESGPAGDAVIMERALD
jgi:ribosomal protein S18 acetylase RimI-like enzyme